MKSEKSHLRKIKIVLEYDGSRFHGWQRQPKHLTVQQSVEEALAILLQRKEPIIGSGRTDAGVHAFGQVAHCAVSDRYSDGELLKGLNRLLPKDIVVREVAAVSDEFHARKSAIAKTYRYLVLNQGVRPAILREYYWWVPHPLDYEKMKEALEKIQGTHDFKGFQVKGSSIRETRRTLLFAGMDVAERIVQIELIANGFLKQMARSIVGTLVDVGRGRFSPERIEEILSLKDRSLAGRTAPAAGLYYISAHYDESQLRGILQNPPTFSATTADPPATRRV
ncbi:MAG: tRNA pseudouridine(38-40) synthase TruA [Deltaproteobacteria bacterium]|nr:tRNA pseudouridine(38-40) synthase TruA [Deltaproteobacteria bacterium]